MGGKALIMMECFWKEKSVKQQRARLCAKSILHAELKRSKISLFFVLGFFVSFYHFTDFVPAAN